MNENLTLKPYDYLILRFDTESFDLSEMQNIVDFISKQLPKTNNVLGLPKDIELEIIHGRPEV